MMNYSGKNIKSILILSLASQIAQAVIYPGDTCCDFYCNTEFEGNKFRMCLGENMSNAEQNLPYEGVNQI